MEINFLKGPPSAEAWVHEGAPMKWDLGRREGQLTSSKTGGEGAQGPHPRGGPK